MPFVLLDAPGRAAPGVRGGASRAGGRRARVGGVSTVRNRIEVMHGVNLDQLGRRDPATTAR